MRWVLPLAASLLACACATTTVAPPDAGRPPECETRADCPTGKICTAEKSCESCESSGQCSVKEVCDEEKRLCTLRMGWGSACTVNGDCQAGAWCKQGLCVDRSEVSLCPGGTKAECPQGLRCNTINTVCEEDLGCADDFDCGAGELCNVGSRQCVPRCTVDTQSQVCGANEKCVKERCVQCAGDADCGAGLKCDAAGKCSAGSRCYSDRDCKVPLVCFVATGACLPKAPPCISNDSCPTDFRCDVGKGKCVPKNCQADRYEPNNAQAQAFGVAALAYRDLTLCPGDTDWFSITLGRGDQLGINIDADPFSESSFSTVVKDDTGRVLSAGKLLTSYVASAPAKYFVVVSTTDAFQSYDATFLLSRGVPCDDDAREPNDSAAQATALNTASSIDGAICPQDQDWFSVNVPASKSLKTSLTQYDASKGLLRLCAFDGMTQLSCSDDTLPVVQVAPLVAGGKTLSVRVIGSTERIANGYTLKVEFP